jgi:hypothetical protein
MMLDLDVKAMRCDQCCTQEQTPDAATAVACVRNHKGHVPFFVIGDVKRPAEFARVRVAVQRWNY